VVLPCTATSSTSGEKINLLIRSSEVLKEMNNRGDSHHYKQKQHPMYAPTASNGANILVHGGQTLYAVAGPQGHPKVYVHPNCDFVGHSKNQ